MKSNRVVRESLITVIGARLSQPIVTEVSRKKTVGRVGRGPRLIHIQTHFDGKLLLKLIQLTLQVSRTKFRYSRRVVDTYIY